MYFLLSLFFCFLLRPCILARHVVFIWDVQTLIFVYMALLVYGWLWFTFMVICIDMCMDVCLWICIYGFVFLDLYLWLYVYGYVYLGVFGYVFGYVYGYRVSILREAWFNKYRGLPLLGALLHH